MTKTFSTIDLFKKLKTNAFILNSRMPMGYVPGLPILCILNENLCMKVPFLKYKVTGKPDKTLVYPIRYVATIIIPEGHVVCFEDLALHKAFANMDFLAPIGTFRHEAVKDWDKKAYDNLRSDLLCAYDKIVNSLAFGDTYSADEERTFKDMFNRILEPSLRPFYKVIDPIFANKYISER